MDKALYDELLAEIRAAEAQQANAGQRDLSQAATEEMLQKPLPGQKDETIPGTALAASAEEPAVPFQPVSSESFKRKPTQRDPESLLDAPRLSPSLVDDFRVAVYNSSAKDINPFALGDSPREVFNKAVTSGLISPDFKPSEDMGALTPYWDQYQLEMRGGTEGPSFFGAMLRGAKSSVGPTLGGIAGGAVGSMTTPFTGPVGPITLGMAGSVLGGQIQESFFPTTPEEQAQVMFDYKLPETKWGRLIGEYIPQFLTDRPGLSTKAEAAINAGIAAGGKMAEAAREYFGDKEIDKELFRDQLIADIAFSVLTKPNKIGQALFDRNYRREVEALKRRNLIAEGAAGGRAGAEAAQAAIAEAMPLNTPDVQLGFGNMSMNSGLIAMQAALERRDGRLMDQRIAAKEGTSKALGGATSLVGEAEETAGEYARMKFEGQNAEMLTEAGRLRDSLKMQGQIEGAAIFDDAAQMIETIGREAEAGRISSIEANARAMRALAEAQSRLSVFSGSATKESASMQAALKFNANEAISDKIVDAAYVKARREGGPALGDFSSTYKAAKKIASTYRSVSQKKKGEGLHKVLENIIDAYAPFKNGKFRPYGFEQLRRELIVINSALRKEQKGTQEFAQLSAVRDGIEKDLKKVGEKHQLLKEANDIYKIHSDKYDKESSGVAKYGPKSEFLDTFLNANIEEQRRLRSALSDPATGQLDPSAAMDIEQWLVNKLTNTFGSEPKAKTLQEWRRKNEVTAIVEDAFPEVKPGIDKFIQDVADTERAALETTTALKRAEDNKEEVVKFNARAQEDAARRKEAQISKREKQAEAGYAETERQLRDTAAARFIGPAPLTAVRNLMEDRNRDSRREMAALVQRANQDPTGRALESLRNAVRLYLKEKSALFAQVVSKSNDPTKEIKPEDLASSMRALNEQLDPANTFRQTLNVVLDQKEIEALKFVRKQIELLTRRTSLTQGESSTAYNTIYDAVLQEGLSGNLINIFGQLAKGIDPSRRAGVSRFILEALETSKKLWKGNVAKRTEELMFDAMTDPNVAIEMLRPVKDITAPRAKAFLQLWTLTKDRNLEFQPLPFNATTTYQEDLANGSVTTDTESGYKIVRTPQKNFRLFSPEGEPMGIFRSFEEAEAKSLTDRQRRIMKSF
jgi:hypothetical protein